MKRARGVVSMRHQGARAVLLALAVLAFGRRAIAADLEAETEPEQSVTLAGGEMALQVSASAELQTRWGPVIALGAGARQWGPSVNAYAGDSIPLGRHWSLRPGFRFVRSWHTFTACSSNCGAFSLYIGELGFRYRDPSGFFYELGLPLFAWLPVSTAAESQSHLAFYTLATPEITLVSTVLVGFTFDL